MKILDSNSYQEIRTWIYRNARHIELTIWESLFENGNKESVLSALAFYQNEDGGFGNTLEADSWNPNSSPYTTLYAINILRQIDFNDMNHPIMQGIIKFLRSRKYYSDNKWLFSIPSNNDYAHAPWWTYNNEANEVESIGITAEIASFIIEHFDSNDGIYECAILSIHNMINKLKTRTKYGDMGVGGYCVLLNTIQKVGLNAEFDYVFLLETVKRLVFESIEKDTSKWADYGARPSNYINSPSSIFYKDNEDIVQKELDYLIEKRPSSDVWGITWSWFENNEQYYKQYAISENWWKSVKAIEKLIFLRNFGRLT